MSMMCLFVLFFFPRGVLDEILNLIESVSEGFPSYFFKANFVSQFSHELYKLESSNMVFTCRMCNGIMRLRLRLIAHIRPFCPLFFFF